jgi:hypothetical protein
MQYIVSAPQRLEKRWDLSDEIKFTTALEASHIVGTLRYEARQLNYNKDIFKLISNADKLVSRLGNEEVRARQLHKPYLANKTREELTNAIDYIQKMLLILRLTQ